MPITVGPPRKPGAGKDPPATYCMKAHAPIKYLWNQNGFWSVESAPRSPGQIPAGVRVGTHDRGRKVLNGGSLG